MGENMKRVLGTSFEMSLRVALLLDESEERDLSVGIIAALDFITIYANDFELAESNLHGNSKYRFGEFASRRELAREALRKLVLDGIVLTGAGDEFAKSRMFGRLLKRMEMQSQYEFAQDIALPQHLSKISSNLPKEISEYVLKRIKELPPAAKVTQSKSREGAAFKMWRNDIKPINFDAVTQIASSNKDFVYYLSDKGISFAANLECDYAIDYRSIAKNAIAKFKDTPEHNLYEMINQKTIDSLRRG